LKRFQATSVTINDWTGGETMLTFNISTFIHLSLLFVLFHMIVERYRRNKHGPVHRMGLTILYAFVILPLGSLITHTAPPVLESSAAPLLLPLMLGGVVYSSILLVRLLSADLKSANSEARNVMNKRLKRFWSAAAVTSLGALCYVLYKQPVFRPFEWNDSIWCFVVIGAIAFLARYTLSHCERLPSLEHKYELLYEFSSMPILLVDNEGLIRDANPEAIAQLGLGKHRLLLSSFSALFLREGDTRPEFAALLRAQPNSYQGDYTFASPHGAEKQFRIVNTHRTPANDRYQYIVLNDITEMKASHGMVSYLAYHDTVTGSANRFMFQRQLHKEANLAAEKRTEFAVLLIDLVRFKQINDTQGHNAGDLMLKYVADVINRNVPANATVGRLGGDKFAVILPDIPSKEHVAQVSEQLLDGFAVPFIHKDHAFPVSASMGICLSSEKVDNPDELVQLADIALNYGKRQGENCIALYEPSLHSEELLRFQMVNDIREALDKGQFKLYYQPQTDMRTGEVFGAEALIRWDKPGVGMIPPNEFIEVAEEAGIIVEIGYWVLETACSQLQAWMDSGMPPICLSINLSARQFLDLRFPQQLMETIQRTGIDPKLLCLEITERTAMSDVDHSIEMCREIMSHEVQLSIDDFGTGYSSLAILKNLSVHAIKVDRSFVKDMVTDESDRAIIKAIIAMSHSLGKRVVAEGVETKAQWDMLAALDCDDVQGYYISRPLTAADFFEFIKTERSLSTPSLKI
jgi:diguanylate cyclase (GGDEF)-like protein/PAS domain S-box-containing protein